MPFDAQSAAGRAVVSARLGFLASRMLALWLLCLSAAGVFAREVRLPVSTDQALVLSAPDDWVPMPSSGTSSQATTVTLAAADPARFSMTVSLVAGPGRAEANAISVRAGVERAAGMISPRSVEKELRVLDLGVTGAEGYYFVATDSQPEPSGYKQMLQGLLRMGDLVVVFTALFDDNPEMWTRAALQTIRSVRRETIGAIATSLRPDQMVVERGNGGYTLRVPVSRLTLTIPQPQMARQLPQQGGSAASPRYFMLADDARNLYVSGWFEPDHRFKGLAAWWAEQKQAWQTQAAVIPLNEEMVRVGGWQMVSYDTETQGIHSTHLRAHWVQAGTWIEVHLSLSGGASDLRRQELVAVLKTFAVAERASD